MENSSFTSNFKIVSKVVIGGAVAFILMNILLAWAIYGYDAQDAMGRSVSNGKLHMAADVLFIGDSRTHQGLDPRIFAEESARNGIPLTAINLACPGMQGPFFYFITKDYLDNTTTKPKVIIANISFYMLGGTQWLEDIYMAYYTPHPWQIMDAIHSSLRTPYQSFNWYMRTRIPAMRYNKRISGLIDAFAGDPLHGLSLEYEHNKPVTDIINNPAMRGYLSSGDKAITSNPTDYNAYKIGFDNGYSVYADYFKRFFALAAENRINVIIYPFPWPEQAGKSENFHKVYAHYEALIRSFAEGNPYIHFVNYDFFWPMDNFVDPLHLNQKGADKLTRKAVCWALSYGAIDTKSNLIKTKYCE